MQKGQCRNCVHPIQVCCL